MRHVYALKTDVAEVRMSFVFSIIQYQLMTIPLDLCMVTVSAAC